MKKALTVHVRAHTVVGRTRADLAMVTRAGKCGAKRDPAFVCTGAGAVTVRQGQRGGRRLEPSLNVYIHVIMRAHDGAPPPTNWP